jgi:hypothetical protein
MDLNPLSRLWKKLSSNALLCACFNEFMKVAKLAMVQITRSVEDERIFSTFSFMKTRLWNRLCEHLDLVVCIYVQPFYPVDAFAYHDAITTWIEEKTQRGFLA